MGSTVPCRLDSQDGIHGRRPSRIRLCFPRRCTNDHLAVGSGRASARLEITRCALWGRVVVSVIPVATEQELKAEIERLRAENESLKRPTRGQTSLKVSEKGALSVYGMGRFPITLYREQWEKLLGMADEIRAFIQQNDSTPEEEGITGKPGSVPLNGHSQLNPVWSEN